MYPGLNLPELLVVLQWFPHFGLVLQRLQPTWWGSPWTLPHIGFLLQLKVAVVHLHQDDGRDLQQGSAIVAVVQLYLCLFLLHNWGMICSVFSHLFVFLTPNKPFSEHRTFFSPQTVQRTFHHDFLGVVLPKVLKEPLVSSILGWQDSHDAEYHQWGHTGCAPILFSRLTFGHQAVFLYLEIRQLWIFSL